MHTELSGTELTNHRTAEMDTLNADDLVSLLHCENHTVAAAVDPALPQIAIAVVRMAERIRAGGRVFYVGAGTSGRLGVLDASEWAPTFGVPPDLACGIIAGGDTALRSSIEGAEDDVAAGRKGLQACGLKATDTVVGIAASGSTPYTLGALQYAQNVGALTVALVNVARSPMSAAADIAIEAVTGPEALTGSTRLKAGTAQKMALNLLSTGVMVLLGKVYGNLMVDVQATNDKLRARALRIVQSAAPCGGEEALAALDASDWHAKTAIATLLLHTDAAQARERLAEVGGSLRRLKDES